MEPIAPALSISIWGAAVGAKEEEEIVSLNH